MLMFIIKTCCCAFNKDLVIVDVENLYSQLFKQILTLPHISNRFFTYLKKGLVKVVLH